MRTIETFLHIALFAAIGTVATFGIIVGRRQYRLLYSLKLLQDRREELEINLRQFTERKPSPHTFEGETENKLDFILKARDSILSEVTGSARKVIREAQRYARSLRSVKTTEKLEVAKETVERLEEEYTSVKRELDDIYEKRLVNEEYVEQIHFLIQKAEYEFAAEQRMYTIKFPFLADLLVDANDSYKIAVRTLGENDPLRAHQKLVQADELVSALDEYVERLPDLLQAIQQHIPRKLEELEDSINSIHNNGYKMKEKPPERYLSEAYDILQSLLPLWREGRMHEVIMGIEQIETLQSEILSLFSEQHRLSEALPQLLGQLPHRLAELHEDDEKVELALAQLKRDFVVAEDDVFLYFTDLTEMDREVAKLLQEAEECCTATEQNYILAEEKLKLAQSYIGVMDERKKEINAMLSNFLTLEMNLRTSLNEEINAITKLRGRINRSVINGMPPLLDEQLKEAEGLASETEQLFLQRPLKADAIPATLESINEKRVQLEKTVGQWIYAADLAHEEMARAERFKNINSVTSLKWKDAEIAFDNYMFKEAFELASDVCREGQGEDIASPHIHTLSRSKGRKKEEREKVLNQ